MAGQGATGQDAPVTAAPQPVAEVTAPAPQPLRRSQLWWLPAAALLLWPVLLHLLGAQARALAVTQPAAAVSLRALALVVALGLPALGLLLLLRPPDRQRRDDVRLRRWSLATVVAPALFTATAVLDRLPGWTSVPHRQRLAWLAALLPFVLVSALAGAPGRPAGQRWNARRARRLTLIRRVHRAAAVIILVFAMAHLGNHLLALVSLDLHLHAQQWLRQGYRLPPLEGLLLAAVAVQVVAGLWLVLRGPGVRADSFALLQLCAGLYLAAFLVLHVSATAFLFRDLTFHGASGGAGGLWAAPSFLTYYALGPLALFTHVACATRALLAPRLGLPRATKVGRAVIAAGLGTTLLIGLALAGVHLAAPGDRQRAHPITVPPTVR
jgi:hypothetical protein